MRLLAAALAALATVCRPIPPLLLLVLGGLPLSAAAVTRVDDDTFDGDSGALRYREAHWLRDDRGRYPHVRIVFCGHRCACRRHR